MFYLGIICHSWRFSTCHPGSEHDRLIPLGTEIHRIQQNNHSRFLPLLMPTFIYNYPFYNEQVLLQIHPILGDSECQPTNEECQGYSRYCT